MRQQSMGERSRKALALPPSVELDLVDDESRIGWISGDRVGFRGFADRAEAVHAAWVAHDVLVRRLTGAPSADPASSAAATFVLARHAGHETILVNGAPIARLVQPNRDDPDGSRSFGFEIQIPAALGEIGARGMAHRMYLALRASGIRWTLLHRTGAATHAARLLETQPTGVANRLAVPDTTHDTEPGGDPDVTDRTRDRTYGYLPSQWGTTRRPTAERRSASDVHGVR
jgi:hypothetical protein